MNLEGRRWVSIREAAAYLGIHPMTAYALFYRGAIPGVRVGRSVRVDFKKLVAELEDQERSAAARRQGDI